MESKDRRSVLHILGATAMAGLAGCGSSGNGSSDNTNDQPETTTEPQSGDGTESSSSSGETLSVTEVDVEIEGDWTLRGEINDSLLIMEDNQTEDQEIVHYDDETDRGFHNVDGDFTAVENGVAYKAIDELKRDGQVVREWVIMSGGEELYRKDDGERPQVGDIIIYGTMDGEPLWVDRKDAPGTIRKGLETIETSYDEVGSLTLINGELGYLGLQDQDGYSVVDAVVIGGEVYESIERGASWLTEIDGEPAYVKGISGGGEAVFYQGEQYGAQYTSRKDGSIGPVFELNSKLGFVATVAENAMENPDREEEQVLWYDGDEVGRHLAIDLASPTVGKSYATYVDGKISYRFRDEQNPSDPDTDLTSGVMYGREELAPERFPSRVYDINGKPTYSISTTAGEGRKIVYGNQETTSYEDILTFVEAEETLYFTAGNNEEKRLFREQ